MQANLNEIDCEIARKLGLSASRLQEQRTGHTPTSVSVILLNDTLVVTLHNALTHAEKDLAMLPDGAISVQEYHRRLFASDSDEMRGEIKRLTGRDVRETGSEIEPATGTMLQSFTSGAMVQVFLLRPLGILDAVGDPSTNAGVDRAENEGLRVMCEPDC